MRVFKPTIREEERKLTPKQRRERREARKLAKAAKRAEKKKPVQRHSNEYLDRISSPEWKVFRLNILSSRGACCESCGSTSQRLDLHHKHYRTLGHESPEDVQLLCRACHNGRHGLSLQGQKIAVFKNGFRGYKTAAVSTSTFCPRAAGPRVELNGTADRIAGGREVAPADVLRK